MTVPLEVPDDDALLDELAARWNTFLLWGLLSAIVGVVIIARPIGGVYGLVLVIAVALILSGIGELTVSSRWGSARWVAVVWGAVSIAAGVGALVWPQITVFALALLIGISLILRGAIQLIAALVLRPARWAWWAALGVLELGVGIAAIAWPGATLMVIAVLIGINMVAFGVLQVLLALSLRSLRTD